MFLPEYVKKIITALTDSGFEAYVVGGCVRDVLLGLTPYDYDVTTSANPDEIKASLTDYSIHDTGLKHGTVTVVADDFPIEVTTFRIDGDYTDNRRPDTVTFTRSLREDLSRRDFTVNAMAYSDKTGIVDYFNGQWDLANGIIRAVGDANKRFNEDGLRILRALRFAAVFGKYRFSIEASTAKAAHELRSLIKNIAEERIAQELNKLVLGEVSGVIADYFDIFAEFIPEITVCRGFDQRSRYHDRDVLTHILNAMDYAPADKITRLALLFHDIGKPATFKLTEKGGSFRGHPLVSAQIARRVMRNLKYDNDTRIKVQTLVKYHDIPLKPCGKAIKRMLNRFGEEQFFRLVDVHIADYSAKAPGRCEALSVFHEVEALAKKIIEEQSCFSLKQLAVKGGDLVEMGYKGKEIGKGLNCLLQAVISEKCSNDRGKLIEFLKKE